MIEHHLASFAEKLAHAPGAARLPSWPGQQRPFLGLALADLEHNEA